MGATSKQRSPSRCREWERERRNKFNQAVTKLGELIKTTNKENQNDASKDSENTQYPKIEIIQRAIIFIKDYSNEKSKLKAEILALQVKLDAYGNQKVQKEKKDVSTQISSGLKTKLESIKQKKQILKKSNNNVLKEKLVCTTKKTLRPAKDATSLSKVEVTIIDSQQIQSKNLSSQKLTKILPKSADAKGPENTIVVVPATPYLIPQRPLLFPATPPTFVLLNPNMQAMTKSTIPIINRNNDITKTTMVNILPISAYSHPLSATKSKKNNVRHKNENSKKKVKSVKKTVEIKDTKTLESNKATVNDKATEEEIKDTNKDILQHDTENENKDTTVSEKLVSASSSSGNKTKVLLNVSDVKVELNNKPKEKPETKDTFERPKENDNTVTETNSPKDKVLNNTVCTEKNIVGKVSQSVDKTKLTNILDTALCENTVDGGNARLELAEELLAASPTAAFLMSFPLVSGNRADSPADDPQNVAPPPKDANQRRNDLASQPVPYFEKTTPNYMKEKSTNKSQTSIQNKQVPQKFAEISSNTKPIDVKISNAATIAASNENPFLNLPTPSVISTNCTLSDPTFTLDFDCNINKSLPSQSTTYGTSNNLFYKSDPFNTVKNSIYSTSSISSGHDFNSLGLYPCAMEKYSSKTKSDYSNVEDNLMKIGSSRLTYDIDLGWSHKGFDFVNPTTSSTTFNKDNLLTTVSTPYTTSYNPFNPEFHMPLVSSSTKKDTSKPSSSFADTIASLYSQTSNLWSEEMPFYTSNSISTSKTFPPKQQNYLPLVNSQTPTIPKQNSSMQYETKHNVENCAENVMKSSVHGMSHQMPDKYTKKSPSKMHINWMTSETRPMQNICPPTHTEVKEHKISYGQIENVSKKHDQTDGNYFPISIHNYSTHVPQEEFPVWPSARPLGTTEISIDPPPINLPTLVGDLALGPHDRKRNAEMNRGSSQADIQNCSNFLSVTQLMNRSTDNMNSRYQGPNNQGNVKTAPTKQNIPHYSTDSTRKASTSRVDQSVSQPCYSFNDSKVHHPYEPINQYSSSKVKPTKPTDKGAKNQKHSYSAEALIRGGSCSQKLPDNKFAVPSQNYNDCNTQQDSSVAQVSHFPPILDYSDNNYSSQQFSGTTLYNSTTNTISNSFYSNFMPGGTNLISSNYAGAPFSSDLIDYNQSTECNYSNHKYEEFKIKGNPAAYHHDKASSNHKGSRREFSAKHKLECSKKDSKKYQSKRAKIGTEVEDWSEANNLLWQNKTASKRHSNLMPDEIPFPNYVGNQVSSQYQADIFNSHLMPPNVQGMGHNVDRSLASFPVTSRANFNLSTIFPEITMKVQ